MNNLEISEKDLLTFSTAQEKEMEQYRLTKKQYLASNYYLQTNNKLQSVKYAGYKGSNKDLTSVADKLFNNEKVKQYITAKRKQLTNRSNKKADLLTKRRTYTMEDVIEKYIDLIETCNNPSVVRAGLSDLTKILGGFKPVEVDINHNVNYSDVISQARQRLINVGRDVVTIDNQLPTMLDAPTTLNDGVI